MTFPDPYHEQNWHECPKHLQSPHLDPHGLHQTSHMICLNDPCTKQSVKMIFPDPYLDQHGLHQTSHIICLNAPCTKQSVKMIFPDMKNSGMNVPNIYKALIWSHRVKGTDTFLKLTFILITFFTCWVYTSYIFYYFLLLLHFFGLWRCLGHSCQCSS